MIGASAKMAGTPASDAALNHRIVAAHDAGDADTLIELYQQIAQRHEADGNIDAACYFYTYAFVFALEKGHADEAGLRDKLAQYGREYA